MGDSSSTQSLFSRLDFERALSHSLGVQAACRIVAEKARLVGLENAKEYTFSDLNRLAGLIIKEGGLAGVAAQSYLNYLSRKREEAARNSANYAAKERSEFLQSLDLGIAVLEANTGKLLDINALAADLVGLDPDVIMESDSFWAFFEGLPLNHRDEELHQVEVNLLGLAGLKTPVLLSVKHIHYQGSRVLLLSFLDITKQKEALVDLREARDRAKQANRAKTSFLANMSHELRTPLNAVLGFAELLQSTALDANQKELLDSIHESGETLLRLISNILDITKIESGETVLEEAPFDFHRLLHTCCQFIRPQLEGRDVKLIYNLGPGVPQFVLGDQTRTQQIVLHLLNNAEKFTEKGHISLSTRVVSPPHLPTAPTMVEILVSDSGIGIEPDMQSFLFRPFTQADLSSTRKYGGTGLGLALTRAYASMMGGWVRLESVPGEGSSFYCTIPLISTANPFEDLAPVQGAESLLNGREVLLVEDNLVNQKLVTRMLNRLGCRVSIAENGVRAVQMVRERKYAACLMDLQMPLMGGIEAAEAIRATGNDILPIIAFTANAVKEDMERCFRVGMDDYLLKPANTHQLSEKLQAWVGGRQHPRAAPKKKREPSPS